MRLDPDPRYEPGDDAMIIGTPREDTTAELLGLCEEFFRCHASPQTHAELREFLTSRGYHPVTGLGGFIDALGFAALPASSHFP